MQVVHVRGVVWRLELQSWVYYIWDRLGHLCRIEPLLVVARLSRFFGLERINRITQLGQRRLLVAVGILLATVRVLLRISNGAVRYLKLLELFALKVYRRQRRLRHGLFAIEHQLGRTLELFNMVLLGPAIRHLARMLLQIYVYLVLVNVIQSELTRVGGLILILIDFKDWKLVASLGLLPGVNGH